MNNLSKLFLPVAILIAGGGIAWAVYHGGNAPAAPKAEDIQKKADAYVASLDIAPVTALDHIQGSPDAKIVIVEYSDTECPFCKTFHGVLKQVFDTYNPKVTASTTASGSAAANASSSASAPSTNNASKVAWVYRHYPIAELHSKAPKEAEATECVAELGGNAIFWKYLNTIFTNTPSNNELDPAKLSIFADDVGVDKKAFDACLSSGKYAAKIAESVKAGQRAGASATPYTVILIRTTNADGSANIERLPLISPDGNSLGSIPYSSMKAIIERLLNS